MTKNFFDSKNERKLQISKHEIILFEGQKENVILFTQHSVKINKLTCIFGFVIDQKEKFTCTLN